MISRIRNINSKPFSFSIAFHTYFSISDIRYMKTSVVGFFVCGCRGIRHVLHIDMPCENCFKTQEIQTSILQRKAPVLLNSFIPKFYVPSSSFTSLNHLSMLPFSRPPQNSILQTRTFLASRNLSLWLVLARFIMYDTYQL